MAKICYITTLIPLMVGLCISRAVAPYEVKFEDDWYVAVD